MAMERHKHSESKCMHVSLTRSPYLPCRHQQMDSTARHSTVGHTPHSHFKLSRILVTPIECRPITQHPILTRQGPLRTQCRL